MHHGDIWFTWPLFLTLLVRQKIFGGAFWRWFARKKNIGLQYPPCDRHNHPDVGLLDVVPAEFIEVVIMQVLL
jgi:hypothetical protein